MARRVYEVGEAVEEHASADGAVKPGEVCDILENGCDFSQVDCQLSKLVFEASEAVRFMPQPRRHIAAIFASRCHSLPPPS